MNVRELITALEWLANDYGEDTMIVSEIVGPGLNEAREVVEGLIEDRKAWVQVAVHPVWGCDNEAIKDEFRRLQAERDKYLEWFQKADSELERLHFENEQRESGLAALDKKGQDDG